MKTLILISAALSLGSISCQNLDREHHQTKASATPTAKTIKEEVNVVQQESFSIPPMPKEHYGTFLASIEMNRVAFAQSFAAEGADKSEVRKAARSYLEENLAENVFTYWYGTPWDFNGHTRTPRKGLVACGYFVTHTLADVGFKIPRYNWAQQWSSAYIKALCSTPKAFSQATIPALKAFLKQQGDGLYLVGLDNHVGYIKVYGTEVKFVHSNYYQSQIGVMWERIEEEGPFKHSATHLIGKLFSDEMIDNWLSGFKYAKL